MNHSSYSSQLRSSTTTNSSNPQLRRVVKKLASHERPSTRTTPLQSSPLANPPAPLTSRSLATHLNQLQQQAAAESAASSSTYSRQTYVYSSRNNHNHRSLSQTNSEAPSRRSSGPRKIPLIQPVTLETLISKPPNGPLNDALKDLRYLILTEGIQADADGHSNIRIYIWSILLGVPPMKTSEYLAIVRRGPSPAYSKIRNDTFRTLATDPLFRRKVSEASLIRLLNAYANTLRDTGVDASAQYVQGMNVLAAPFLYASKNEVEAFAMFSTFIRRECPAYVKPALEGVHKGLKLVDQCLETVDPKLYFHLKDKFLSAELYAFPSVLTLSACTPPLPEVLILWDFLLAYGAHLNILCVVAQLLLMREDLLAAQSPMKLFRQFPPLQSKNIIKIAVSLVNQIPRPLFDELVNHAR